MIFPVMVVKSCSSKSLAESRIPLLFAVPFKYTPVGWMQTPTNRRCMVPVMVIVPAVLKAIHPSVSDRSFETPSLYKTPLAGKIKWKLICQYMYCHPNPLKIYWQVRSMSLTYRIYICLQGLGKCIISNTCAWAWGCICKGILSQGTREPCAGIKLTQKRTMYLHSDSYQ